MPPCRSSSRPPASIDRLTVVMEKPDETPADNPAARQSRRLLWAIGVGGLFFLVIGLTLRWSWSRQMQVLTEIERVGGEVKSEPVGPDWLRRFVGEEVMAGYDRVVLVNLDGSAVTDVRWAYLEWLTHLEELYLDRTQVTDADLVHISELTKLRKLSLWGTTVGDAGLVHLEGLTKLELLFLSSTKVTDAGMVHLRAMTNMDYLTLIGTNVTDDGLVHLEDMKSLRDLSLRNTQVTDAALVHLRKLPRLRFLSLHYTKVTDAGIEEWKQAMPHCGIYNTY